MPRAARAEVQPPATPWTPHERAHRGIRRRPPRSDQTLRDRIDRFRTEAQHIVDEYVPVEVQKEAHRKGFHMVAGIVATPLVLYAGLRYTTYAALATLVVIVSLELLLGRFRIAVPVLTRQLLATRRPHERFSWASTMFIVAALAILWLTPLPVAFAALAMLGLGDGVAALVGKSIGRNKLWYNPKKSWEGSLAGFLIGAVGAIGMTAWYYAYQGLAYPLVAIVPISVAGALAAMVAESVPQWEDNFSVPIAASLVMSVLWATTGLAPRFGEFFQVLAGYGWMP